jgi:hypothetical protein
MPSMIFTGRRVAVPTATALSATVAQLASQFPSSPAWSSELTDARYRYLASTEQPQHTGTTAIYPNAANVLIGTWGEGATAGGRRALQGFNTSNASTELLMGANGPSNLTGWDSQTGIWHVAGTTGSNPFSQTLFRYNPATDEIRRWSAAAEGDNTTSLWQYGGAHNFGGSVLDVRSRRIFRLLRTSTSSNQWAMGWAYIDDLVAGQGRTAARRAINPTLITSESFMPIELLPNVGSAGSILVMKVGTADWPLFDLATNEWSGTRTHAGISFSMLPATVYHEGYVYMAFARHSDALYTISDNNFWRVPAAGGAPENLGVPPTPMNGAANFNGDPDWQGDWFHTEFVSLNGAIYAFGCGNPNTPGENGTVYRYNGSWTLVDEMPLKAMGVPLNEGTGSAGGNYDCFSVCAVPDHNCVVLMNTALGINGSFWGDRAVVWKP